MTDKVIVLSTCGSEEEADKIAQHLVQNRLAACVNLLPQVKSIYRWQEKVESAWECLLMVKTTREKLSRVRDAILSLHSYALPECVVIPIDDGSAAYLQWIEDNVK